MKILPHSLDQIPVVVSGVSVSVCICVSVSVRVCVCAGFMCHIIHGPELYKSAAQAGRRVVVPYTSITIKQTERVATIHIHNTQHTTYRLAVAVGLYAMRSKCSSGVYAAGLSVCIVLQMYYSASNTHTHIQQHTHCVMQFGTNSRTYASSCNVLTQTHSAKTPTTKSKKTPPPSH